MRFAQLSHCHGLTTSLISATMPNPMPKRLPWGSLFALDDPITVINTAISKQAILVPGESV